MLEVRHLTKIYTGKGGVETRALDDVSVRFADAGLIFILGKSGCGKSTFLNIVGGLDAPSDGEIIVNGKSSREFTEADFDAYRNTCVGFVFQEYNVLDEFTVEDNVAIALELQREKNVKGKVEEILREVDLDGFAKRKPNTLSGGQKQRIAIARALVKDPQIIMADEPTGALDSVTGRQVLETLKSLSRTRLVVVVSHDRDFAEEFGDRIIELSDGRIISDVTKVREKAEETEGSIKQVSPNILSVKGGSLLSEENIKAIQAFVSAGEGDVIITKGEAEVESFKKANGIAQDYAVESFMATHETPEWIALETKEPERKDTKFIRSRLPMTKAIRMGVSSLKVKPVRLVFTILLSVIAFIFFGLLSCLMTYNITDVATRSFTKSYDQYLNLTKSYQYSTVTTYYSSDETDTSVRTRRTYFNEADAEALDVQDAMFAISYSGFIENASFESEELYYRLQLNKAVYVPEGNPVRENLLYGTYPENDTEVCISSFLAESIIRSKFSDVSDLSAYEDYEDAKRELVSFGTSMNEVIGHHIIMGSQTAFTITGIFDAGDIPSAFDKVNEEGWYSTLYDNYLEYLFDSMDENILVTRGFIEEQDRTATQVAASAFDTADRQYYLGATPADGKDMSKTWELYPSMFAAYGDNSLATIFIDGEERTSLADDETVISLYWLMDKTRKEYIAALAEEMDTDSEEYTIAAEEFEYGRFDAQGEESYNIYRAMEGLMNGSYEYSCLETETHTVNGEEETTEYYAYETHTVTAAERSEMIQYVNAYFLENPVSVTLCENDYSLKSSVGTYKVVGYYTGYVSPQGISGHGMYLSENSFASIPIYSHTDVIVNYELPDDAVFYYMIVPVQHKTSMWLRPVMKQLEKADETTGVLYSMANNLYQTILTVDEVMQVLIIVFLIAGIIFAVFAALLLFNFISVSIAGKSKEIGILRAVGAKGGDVFKIFFSEASVIVLICFILAVIFTAIVVAIVNYYIQAAFSIMVYLLVFSGWCVLMIFGIALIVAVLGTFLPVYFASRKKPVESIRAL